MNWRPSSSKMTDRGSTRIVFNGCSNRFSPRKITGRVWGWRSFIASRKPTTDACGRGIESAAGRDFTAARNSARPIDVDILHIEGVQVSAPDLQVPHAAMHARAFVLAPLAEIAGAVRHPTLERSFEELLAALPAEDRAAIRRYQGPEWARPAGPAGGS